MSNAAAALSGDTATNAAASVDADAQNIAATVADTVNQKTPASNDQWWGKFENQDVRTWTEAKGFKDPQALAESAYNLEKLMGFDKAGRTIVLPDENATPEQLTAFRSKIGVPETVEGYKLPVPEGVPQEFAGEASKWFHEAGIPAKAAEQIATKWNEYTAAMTEQAEKAFAVKSEQEFNEWRASQGAAADQNIELARRAASQFIPAADAAQRQTIISKIERAMGTGDFMQMMANIGAGLGEHKVHPGGEGGTILTPAQAQQRINELRSNQEWTSAYLKGDKAKLAEMENLTKLAFPEGA